MSVIFVIVFINLCLGARVTHCSLLLSFLFACLVCFISTIKIKVGGLRESQNKMVPVDSAGSILASRWTFGGVASFLRDPFSEFCRLHLNLDKCFAQE